MTLEEYIADARRDLDDVVQPYLYSDAELIGWFNQAVLEATIRARLLKDDAATNPDLCALPVTAGQQDVTYSNDIFVIRHAAMAGATRPLKRYTSKTMDRLEPGWDQHDPADIAGEPKYLVMDMSQRVARLYPPSATAGTLNIRVWRKPLEAERMEVSSDEPVIAISEPVGLKDWVLRCAYLVKDSELYDEARAARHEGIFEARFGPRPDEQSLQRWLDSPPTQPRGHYF
jgi:hypothetical protein